MFQAIWAWIAAHLWAAGLDVLLTAILLYPLVDYLRYGWVRKKEEIEGCMSGAAKLAYFDVWLENKNNAVTLANADAEFEKFYLQRYGRMRFFWPILFVLLIAVIGNGILGQALFDLKDATDTKALHLPAAAIAGAYTFVAWDFFARVQRRALGTCDVLRGALRLAMAVPLGFVLGGIADGGGAVLLAFGIGVFPFDDVKIILRRLVYDRLKVPQDDGKATDPVTNLSGIDTDTADRIADADVATIPQLAWTDPIQMVMRTNLSFDFVVDIVSQALAWVYFGDNLHKLRRFGLRGAYEIRTLKEDLGSTTAAVQARAKSVMFDAAKEIGLAETGMLNAIEEIAGDTATGFLCKVS
jgi:hypothetical protein